MKEEEVVEEDLEEDVDTEDKDYIYQMTFEQHWFCKLWVDIEKTVQAKISRYGVTVIRQ